jgi:hypothetical protein
MMWTQSTTLPPRSAARSKSSLTPSSPPGIAQLQNYLEIIDTTRSHPCRPQLLGRPVFTLLWTTPKGELLPDTWDRPWDRTHPACSPIGIGLPPLPLPWRVRQSIDARGLARARAELQAYDYPQTGDGEEMDRPTKIFDDVIDPLRALADAFFPRPSERPRADRGGLNPSTCASKTFRRLPPQQQSGHYFTRFTRGIEIEHELKKQEARVKRLAPGH